MAEASIPVDLLNPGQVLACLGFMEAAEKLLGNAEGGFERGSGGQAHFFLRCAGEENPFANALAFVAGASVDEIAAAACCPAPKPDGMALPVRLQSGPHSVVLSHWTDGSSREPFKTYAGNRTAAKICHDMVQATARLRCSDPALLAKDPFAGLVPLGGAFGWDARKAWNALNAGYSPDEAGHAVLGSPVVEIMAAWGLENARPVKTEGRAIRYGIWLRWLPLLLARAALGLAGDGLCVAALRFNFESSGKNKIATFAAWEDYDDDRDDRDQ